MTTEITMVDGTKFEVDGSVDEFVNDTDPGPGWVYISEGDGTPRRYFNPANIAYVRDVEPPSFDLGAHKIVQL